jgi:hypothetical protein
MSCAFILCSCCSLCRYRPCVGLIPRQKSPTEFLLDYGTEKAAKSQQKICRVTIIMIIILMMIIIVIIIIIIIMHLNGVVVKEQE